MSYRSGGGRFAEVSDEALVDTVLERPESERSRDAASELFGRYIQPVYGWCCQYVREHERAMDLAQDVLYSGYRNLISFRGTARFSSWLFAITRNRCLNEIRRPSLIDENEFDPDRTIDPAEDPAGILEQKLDEGAVLGLIRDHLDPREQEVLWLRGFEKMPIELITEVMEIEEVSGARGLLQRARRKLRAALDQSRAHGGKIE